MSIVDLENQILDIRMELKYLEHQGNEIYDEFYCIGNELKIKGIYPPYNKAEELQNKYMELDKQIFQIDTSVQELREVKRKLDEELYIEKQKYLFDIYNNKKYKVRTFAENGHVDIYVDDFKPYTSVDRDIVVTKLIKDNDSFVEVSMYSKDYTKLKQINRWYYKDDKYILQEKQVRRLDEGIINRYIYRQYGNGDSMVTIMKSKDDSFIMFSNASRVKNISVTIANKKAITEYRTRTTKFLNEITQDGQEIIEKVLEKLKNDKYVDFRKEYELAF